MALRYQTQLVKRGETWYIARQENLRQPVEVKAETLEQLRWALGDMCLAVNADAIEIEVEE